MKKIVIIGFGYIGKAMHRFFSDNYDVCVYDPYIQKSQFQSVKFVYGVEGINSCDLSVICVPTPRAENGECDITEVHKAISLINTPLILLKSTVEIGTTDRLLKETGKRIVFSPEFCGESSYWTPYEFHTDVKKTPFFIFGGDKKDTSEMVDYFMPVTGPVKEYRQTTAKTAEIVKYMDNSFYATKVVFCYEIYEICRRMGIDYNEARDLWTLDPRLNPMHTSVFQENAWPFSGKCFPKDVSALVSVSKKNGYSPELLEEVLMTNKRLHDIRLERMGSGAGSGT